MITQGKAYEIAQEVLPPPSLYLNAALEGTCTTRALLLSAVLLAHGVKHEIVIWRLDVHHPEFRERWIDHWAVAIEFPFVIDPTYPQVKGELRYFVDARYDYPEYYGKPERYSPHDIMAAGGARAVTGMVNGDVLKMRAGVKQLLEALDLEKTLKAAQGL